MGLTNMDFDDGKTQQVKVKKSAPAEDTNAPATTEVNFPNGLSLREVRLVDGEITIKDDRHGSLQKFDGISVWCACLRLRMN